MGRPIVEMTGLRFGALTVVRLESHNRHARWLCRCDCGVEKVVIGSNLRNGCVRTCGCGAIPADVGEARAPEYKAWDNMRTRCGNPKASNYQRYGGRGIKVCAAWQDFATFLRDMGPKPSPIHSLDRIDVNGDYEPGNCRWATPSEQGRNRRNNAVYTVRGKTGCVTELCEAFGLNRNTVYQRLRAGKSPEQAFQ